MSPLLMSRVKTFQQGHGLAPTGVVDQPSWVAMGLPAGQWTAIDCYKVALRIDPTMSRDQIIEAFVATARDYAGSRYIWGGANSPGQGADCSGIVIQALYSVGIDPDPNNTVNHALPTWRSSRNLYAAPGFLHVPLSQVQRGDVVFYRIGSSLIDHTAIYLGGGQIMEETTPRGRVSTLYSHSGLVADVVRPLP
jgi:cell wall-associated NlpC family hydrolase